MENVDESNDSQEQEYAQDDADDSPYGKGLVLENSNHNVGGNLCPLNNACALGQVSHSLCHGCILNAVYNVGNNAVLGDLDKALNLCNECLLINSLGQGVLVSENQGTVLGAFCAYKNQTCGSCGKLANVAIGHHVGVKCRACGNSDNDLVNVVISTRYFVAILIGIDDGVSGVAGNLDGNVGVDFKLTSFLGVTYKIPFCNFTANGVVNRESCGVTNSVTDNSNCNFTGFGILLDVDGYITFNKDFILALYLFAGKGQLVAVLDSRLEEIFKGICRKFLVSIGGIFPDVAVVCAAIGFDNILEIFKEEIFPFVNGSFKRGYRCAIVIEEFHGNLVIGVNPEQMDAILKELCTDGILIRPVTVRDVITGCGSNAFQIFFQGIDSIFKRRNFFTGVIGKVVVCFNLIELVVPLTGNIVVNRVSEHLEIRSNLNCRCRHRERVRGRPFEGGDFLLLPVDRFDLYHFEELKARRHIFFRYSELDGFATSVEILIGCFSGISFKCYNHTEIGKRFIKIRIYSTYRVNFYAVLVNNGKNGEVGSVEGNSSVYYGNAATCYQYIAGFFEFTSFFVYYGYKGLGIVGVETFEGQSNFNNCAGIKFANRFSSTIKCEVELVEFFSFVSCFRNIGSRIIGKTNGVLIICSAKQLCEHCSVQGYLLYVGALCCKNNGIQIFEELCTKEILIKVKVENGEVLCFNDNIPVLVQSQRQYAIFEIMFVISTLNKAVNYDSGCKLVLGDGYVYGKIAGNNAVKNACFPLVAVGIAKQRIFIGKCRIQRLCCSLKLVLIGFEFYAFGYSNGFGIAGNEVTLSINGNDGNGIFGDNDFALEACLEDNVLCGHYGYGLTGLFVYPTKEAFNAGVVNHLGDVGANRQEGGQEGAAVLVYKVYTVDIVYVNGNVNSGGNGCILCKEDIQNVSYVAVELGCNRGCIVIKQAQSLLQSFFKDDLCIKGDASVKYECGVATVEVHQAIVGKLFAVAGSHQTVCNLERLALDKVVDCAAVFKLVYKSSVEVCKRIGRCSGILEEFVQVKVIAVSICKLIDNVKYGVIEVAVDLCGQTVGNLDAGNTFKLFYKYFESRNFSDCIDQVLCFEVVGKVIAGYSFDVCQKNLGIARSENLVVYLAKEGRINCIENSNYFFKGQAFCKRDEVIGACFVDRENLILKCVEFGIVGISHLFESNAQNACKLGRNGDICNQLAAYKLNGADLIHQNRKLGSCCADGVDACGENKGKVIVLGLFYALFIEVRERKGCLKQLAAIVKVCQLIKRGNEIFDSIDQLCRQKLDVTAFVALGDNNTVKLNFGNGLLQACKNVERLNKVFVKVEHTDQLLDRAGLVNDLDQLHNVYLGDNGCGADCLSNAYNVNDISNGAILNHFDSNGFNANDIKDRVKVGYVINNGCKTAGDCIDRSTYTDCLNSSGVILEASYEFVCGEHISTKSCGDLALDNVELNKVVIAVLGSKCIYVDNLSGDQLVKLDNIFVQKILYVQYVCSDKICKIGEQRSKCIITKQKNLNVKRCGDVAITGEQLIIQAFKFIGGNQSIHINRVTVYIRKNDIHRKNTVVNCLSDDGFCVGSIHVIGKLILNTTKQTGKLGLVNVCRNGCRETVNVCIYVNIQCGLIHVSGCKNLIADLVFDVSQICSSLNVNTVKLNSRVDLNDFKELCGGKAQCKIHQLAGVILDKLSGIDVSNCLFEVLVIDVVHQKVNILDVFFQIDSLEKVYKACFVYTSKQSIRIKTFEQRFCVDVSNDRLCKVDQLLLGNDCKELLLGHNTAKTACCGNALEQSLQVAVLQIRQQGLRINGDGNVGSCFVAVRLFFGLNVQPSVSDRTDRQNCQNHYESQQHSENSVELFHNTKPHFV